MSDLYKLWRQERIRGHQRDQVGAGRTQVNFQVPLEGTAQTGISVHPTDELTFGVGFYPKGGEQGGINPMFLCGFSLRPTGIAVDARAPVGLLGFGNCAEWIQNDDGFFVGAIVHIGILNLDDEGGEIPFKGFATLSFSGMASQSPLDSGNHDIYTGPDSVQPMEYYFADEDDDG